MDLLQTVYSVLIVSTAEKFSSSITTMFPASRYFPIECVKSSSAARRLLSEKHFDIIIINYPLLSNDGIEFAIDFSKNAAVLLIVHSDIKDEIAAKISRYGIFALAKPFSQRSFENAVEWLSVARELVRANEQRESSLEEKMGEIRLINHAKLLLISNLKMNEPEAHRYIEKQAMDACLSKRIIAESIIKKYS